MIPNVWAAGKVTMLVMTQTVALLNGLGGLSSALVALTVFVARAQTGAFERITAALALAVGMITLTGSLVAAGRFQGCYCRNRCASKGTRSSARCLSR